MGLKIGTLREIGAKKGDVVAFADDCEYKFTIERLNEGSAYGTAQHCGRNFSDNWSLTATKTWRIVSQDAPTGPVRTVTRKEIVPGHYGSVNVSNGFISMSAIQYNAAELRAAIDTLTEIAQALEEQA